MFNFFGHAACCRILVPQPGIKPRAMAVKAPSPKHWTARELPRQLCFRQRKHQPLPFPHVYTFSSFESPNEPQSHNHHDPESSSCLTLDSSSILTDLKFSSWWLPELPASLRVHLLASEQVKKIQKIPQSFLAEEICPLNVMLHSCEDTWSSPHKKVTEMCMSLRQAHYHFKKKLFILFLAAFGLLAVCGLSLAVASNRLLSSYYSYNIL